MYIGIVSMRYAKALLAYANACKTADTVYAEAAKLSESFLKVPGLKRALDNPVLRAADKEKLVLEAAGGGKISEALQRFVKLVISQRREKFLQFMVMSFMDLYRKQRNISIGKITTASPISPEVIERVRAMVEKQTKGTVEFKTRTDEKLGGGFILEIDTYRLDASVTSQIKRVKQQFIAKNRRIV